MFTEKQLFIQARADKTLKIWCYLIAFDCLYVVVEDDPVKCLCREVWLAQNNSQMTYVFHDDIQFVIWVPEEPKEDAVDKFKKKYGVKKKATVEEQMTAFPDAVAEDGGQLLDEETAGNMAEVIVDAIVESDEVEDM